MKKFALLVGNGFTLDYIKEKGYDSSYPLQNFKSPDIQYNYDFMSHIPSIQKLISLNTEVDFLALEQFMTPIKMLEEEHDRLPNRLQYSRDLDPKYMKAIKNHIELRRFIAMSYSALQIEVDKYNFATWKWHNWLNINSHKLTIAISFNYDLILENSLDASGTIIYRVGTNEFPRGIPILKPHGSLDFDAPDHLLQADSPWDITAKLNDGQMVKALPKHEWLNARLEADIIVPSLHNVQLHLSWVDKMYKKYAEQAEEIEAMVIVGCSYWDVDRPEIDKLLGQLNKRTKVFIIDPKPNKDLIKKIQSLGLSYRKGNRLGLPW